MSVLKAAVTRRGGRRRRTATLIAALAMSLLAGSATSASAQAAPPLDQPALSSVAPPPPVITDARTGARLACQFGVWDGPNYTGRGACFQVTQDSNYGNNTYSTGGTVNNTSGSVFNYSNFRITICNGANFVDCNTTSLAPGQGYLTLGRFDNQVSSHQNSSV